MFTEKKGIIFDLDQTLVDSSSLETMRRNRDWEKVRENIHEVVLYRGIKELIEYLRLKGYTLAIVTSLPSMMCDLYVKQFSLDIEIRICYHDTQYHKPDPDPVLLAIKKMGINPSLSYGLGNDLSDILAYNSAGIKSIFAKWSGFTSPEESLYIANIPADVKSIIEKEVNFKLRN